MAGPIFDSHAHYQSHQFDGDREALLQSLPAAGVAGVVECATDLATSKGALELAAAWPFVWAALGIHPESLIEEDASTNTQFSGDWKAELAAIAPLLAEKKAVAVGEIGLDYHWPIPKDAQLELFEAQIRLALELDKPVIVHDREAHGDTMDIIREFPAVTGVFHCFSGSPEMAAELLKRGWYIGFDGPVTYKNARRAPEVAAITPPERMLVETDSPYMAPVPVRGKRNDSRNLSYVLETLAAWKGMTPEALTAITWENGRRLFRIP